MAETTIDLLSLGRCFRTTITISVIGMVACLGIRASAQETLPGSQTENNFATDSNQPIVATDCHISIVNEVSLSCERSGVLDFITPQGTMVKQGDILVRLRDALAKSAYEIADREASNDIEIRFAKKAGELAQLKYERAQQAEQSVPGTITEFEIRELRLAAERSLLQWQQAEHQFAIANLKREEQREVLNSYQLTAPFDAFVRVAHKLPGEYLQEGEVIIEIIDDRLIRVDGYVDVADLPRVAMGREVLIYLQQKSAPPLTFRGHVSFVDQKIEPISMKARVSAEIVNQNSLLKDGLSVAMAISTQNLARRSSNGPIPPPRTANLED